MSLQFNTALRNTWLNDFAAAVGPTPHIDLFTGAAPQNCALSSTGVLIATIQLPTQWIGQAGVGVSAGTIAFIVPQTTTAIATGTPNYFRLYNSDRSVCVMQGSVGYGADLQISIPTPAAGQIMTLQSLVITAPGA